MLYLPKFTPGPQPASGGQHFCLISQVGYLPKFSSPMLYLLKFTPGLQPVSGSQHFCLISQVGYSPKSSSLMLYRIRTNIGGYNIWRFAEIMDLARYYFGEIIQKKLGSQLIHYRKILAKFKLGDCVMIRQSAKFSSSPIFVLIRYFADSPKFYATNVSRYTVSLLILLYGYYSL